MTNKKMTPEQEAEYLAYLKASASRTAADDAEDEAYFNRLRNLAKNDDAEDESYFYRLSKLAKNDDAEDEAYFYRLTAKEPQEGHYDAIRRMEAEATTMTPTEFFKEIGDRK